ncbi:MAG: hypothetical protein ACLP1X_11650 [Polyangiaceae bacterium]|jgi:hypothetical protein
MENQRNPLAATLALVLLGCGSVSPEVQAAGVEKMQCDGSATAQGEAQLLRSTRVISVEPLYSFVHASYNGGEQRVNGAKLLIRPPEGLTADTLTRILQCRGARRILEREHAAIAADDPFFLPGAWVNVDVRSENGNFAVILSADSVDEGLRVLSRAKRYADGHMLSVQPDLP